MRTTRTRSSVALLAVVLTTVLVTGGLAGPVTAATATDSAAPASTPTPSLETAPPSSPASGGVQDDRPENATTEGTVGYVEGYWYDDRLPVDNQSNAAVDEDDLDPVVYRAMARVERIRNVTFEDEVAVDVISRAEYRAENGDRFTNLTSASRLEQNVGYEALFMVDRNTAAANATETLYGGAVDGYYDPATDEIVIVSENPETPELDELTLAHELVHALQDQRFNLSQLEGSTRDEELATNGLIEGDASLVEREYEGRCGSGWSCLPSEDGDRDRSLDVNWGIYFTVYHPYSDGPDYVDSLRQQGSGWSAVNAAYDDPPTTTSAVIRPGSEREPADVSVPNRSSDGWRQLRADGEVANDTVGEASMVAMFVADAFEGGQPSVIDRAAFLEGSPGAYDYDHSYTDGWVGDELVVYTSGDAGNGSDPAAAASRAGYVWRTQWQSATDAREFVDGYLQLLENHGAEPVDGRRDTYVIDGGGYSGAYYLERNETTLTIVRAPSVDDLSNVEAGAAPEGSDTIAGGEHDEPDLLPGVGQLVALVALVAFGAGIRIAADRGWIDIPPVIRDRE